MKWMEDEIDVDEYREEYVELFLKVLIRITKDIKIREKIFNLALDLSVSNIPPPLF